MNIFIASELDIVLADGINLLVPQVTKDVPSLLQQNVQKILNNSHQALVVAKDDDDLIVGMAVISLVQKASNLEARVDEVVVDESARGQKLGEKLMQASEEWAKQQGADFMELTTRASREAANHLYKQLGYETRETNVYRKNIT